MRSFRGGENRSPEKTKLILSAERKGRRLRAVMTSRQRELRYVGDEEMVPGLALGQHRRIQWSTRAEVSPRKGKKKERRYSTMVGG